MDLPGDLLDQGIGATARAVLFGRRHRGPAFTTLASMAKPSPPTRPSVKDMLTQGQCAGCHTAPFYLDHQMHDLHLERFLKDELGDGPIKIFNLRGIKDSPPYLHEGPALTLGDTVEFFNQVFSSGSPQRRSGTTDSIHFRLPTAPRTWPVSIVERVVVKSLVRLGAGEGRAKIYR